MYLNYGNVSDRIKAAKLTQATRLNLFRFNLTEVPGEIFDLTHLTYLNLGENQLKELPAQISRLKNLTHLFLDNNDLSRLPEEIGSLPKLSYLYLFGNNLTELPEIIGNLKKLVHLYLYSNKLTELPKTIGRLTNLTHLYLYENGLLSLPAEIGELKNLIHLQVDDNNINYIPKGIGNLEQLKDLNIKNNPIKNIPIEIIEQGTEAIRNYLKSLRDEMKIYEAKLLLVGEGGVGKTSLMKRLLYDNFSPGEDTTKGIEINKWIIETRRSKDFRVNSWDFGGQEIYHATHQFFLTKRSLYLFVWEARKDDDLICFDFWLNVIKLLSGGSPLIVVLNKTDERIKMIDEAALKSKFKNITAFFKVSALDGTGVADLKRFICREINNLPHVGDTLPQVWLNIREKLESLDKNFIHYSQYKEICSAFGVDEERAEFLGQYFHDLGVLLHFQDNAILKDIIFLKPEWATNAVYKLVDTKEVQKNCGKFSYSELRGIWNNYPEDKYIHLLELMKRFEICFQLPNRDHYIVPELLPASRPNLEWDEKNNLRFTYIYSFMPSGIITRFIVRLHGLIEENLYWKNGVVLKWLNTRALVINEPFNRKISVWIDGNDRVIVLEIVRNEINYIHKTLNFPDVTEMVPCICSECKSSPEPNFYDFSILKKYKLKNITVTRCPKSLENINIEKALLGFDTLTGDDIRDKITVKEGPFEEVEEEKIKLKTIYVFLASSSSLKAERDRIEKEFSNINSNLIPQGLFIDLKIWEKESQAFSVGRKQDEFNKLVIESDIFICLIYDKVGEFTMEELNTAFKNFQKNKKPKIYLYFKNAPIEPGMITEDFNSVLELKKFVRNQEQYYNDYKNIEDLILKIYKNLDKDLVEMKTRKK